MKTKILCLLVALIAVMACAVSCNFGGGGGGTDDPIVDNTGIKYDYNWTETSILAELSENSASGELTSGCRRYYAGGDTTKYEEIDDAVRDRNRRAAKAANVTVKYDYLDDVSQYAWGANVSRIVTQTKAGSTSMPDIYCNFVYDLTSAALRGCFANLLSEDYANGNHFLFTDDNYNPTSDDYFDSKAGQGYFYQYMESLSLTPDSKLYCLASNYCTDAVRAFLVVPVNVNILDRVTKAPCGDRDNDGDTDVEDFYKMVWNNEWTYDMLAAYTNLVFQTGSQSFGANADLGDEVVGFALGAGSGLSASGILYTTSVQIIKRNETTGEYYYPETNADLTAFAKALNLLFKNNAAKGGVCVVTKSDQVTGLVPTATTELQALRTRFAEDHVLFGGIIAVGSLEDKVYQDMKSTSGFGIVPVPLYRSGTSDEYLTLVHNIARIVAISKSSEKFSQCSAFLDYQSRTSEDILNTYYDVNLTAAVGGVAGEQNSQMLTYIRNHVRNCFDKTYEDAISNYINDTDSTAMSTRWHGILMNREYQVGDDISNLYDSLYRNKAKYLADVYKTWNNIGQETAQ